MEDVLRVSWDRLLMPDTIKDVIFEIDLMDGSIKSAMLLI
jgi:hypothetical protein